MFFTYHFRGVIRYAHPGTCLAYPADLRTLLVECDLKGAPTHVGFFAARFLAVTYDFKLQVVVWHRFDAEAPVPVSGVPFRVIFAFVKCAPYICTICYSFFRSLLPSLRLEKMPVENTRSWDKMTIEMMRDSCPDVFMI